MSHSMDSIASSCSKRRKRLLAPASQRGVGLIEILISVLLLSIGFLAAARMQVEGMRSSQGSYFQSQAYFMVNDIVDRMRLNYAGVREGEYDDNFVTSATASNPRCGTNACTPAEMAEQDLYDWSSLLHNMNNTSNFVPILPNGASVNASGQINDLGDGRYQVTMIWSEIVNGVETAQTFTMNFVTEI